MASATTPKMTYNGKPIKTIGELRESTDIGNDRDALQQRMADEGYLYLPGFLNADEVVAARRAMLEKMGAEGMLDPDAPLMDGIVKKESSCAFNPQLAKDNPELMKVLYDGPMMDFFSLFLGDAVRHFDYTWVRCKGGDDGSKPTFPHYDITYMGRGTTRLFTAWTPFDDVPREMGGLMILEGSHKHDKLKSTYGKHDVDKVCINRPEGKPPQSWEGGFGWYTSDALKAQNELGGRWLTTDYKMGDVLIFSMYTMHASMDNHTNRWRLSTDSRYQLASEPVDERWVGNDPPAHGDRAKKEYIC